VPGVDQGRGLEEGFDGPAVGIGQAHHQRTVVHQQTRNVGYLVGIDRLTGQWGGAAANRLQAQQARIQQLEAEQQRLLALNNDNESTPQSRPQPDAKTADRSEQEALKQQIARMQAQIDRQLEDYAKRPKRLTYGVNATGVNYARYVNAWADRIEKIGTERFPEEARGKMYDSLTVTVEVDKYGNVVDVLINKKSRYDVLNRKVKEIVLAGAPYDKFTPEMRKDGDILQIVRTWTFTNGSLQTKSAKR